MSSCYKPVTAVIGYKKHTIFFKRHLKKAPVSKGVKIIVNQNQNKAEIPTGIVLHNALLLKFCMIHTVACVCACVRMRVFA